MVVGPIREIKIPVQELWLKMKGGVYAVYAGHYGTMNLTTWNANNHSAFLIKFISDNK